MRNLGQIGQYKVELQQPPVSWAEIYLKSFTIYHHKDLWMTLTKFEVAQVKSKKSKKKAFLMSGDVTSAYQILYIYIKFKGKGFDFKIF